MRLLLTIRSSPSRRAIALCLGAAYLAVSGCALHRPGTPTKHDRVQVFFEPFETVTAEDRSFDVRSIVGDAWSVSADSLRLRIDTATSADGAVIAELIGEVVTVGRDRVASILVLDRDHSGEVMAGAVAVWVVASLLAAYWFLSMLEG